MTARPSAASNSAIGRGEAPCPAGPPCRAAYRVALLIKLLAQSPPLAMTEISRAIQLPYATSHRLVTTLVTEGLVCRDDESKRYRRQYPIRSI